MVALYSPIGSQRYHRMLRVDEIGTRQPLVFKAARIASIIAPSGSHKQSSLYNYSVMRAVEILPIMIGSQNASKVHA